MLTYYVILLFELLLYLGKGKKLYKNKTIYEGDWVANKRHGFGVLMIKVDDHYEYVYEGQWIHNRFVSTR